MEIIKVSGNSRTSAVAGAIAGVFRENHIAEVQAIGAGAVNQAVKALVLATGYLAGDGYAVACIPEFVDVEIEGKIRTAVRLTVEEHERPASNFETATQADLDQIEQAEEQSDVDDPEDTGEAYNDLSY